MRRGTIALLTASTLTALGCGPVASPSMPPQHPGSSDRVRTRPGIGLDQKLASEAPDVMAAWLLYGVTLADASSAGGYPAEVRARILLADIWKEKRAGHNDEYLDLLVNVRDAGFIVEYVIAFLARPGWIIPGEDLAKLNLVGFTRWEVAHLPKQHRAVTRAELHDVRAEAPVPGEGLPSSAEIDPRRTPCANLQPAIATALTRWEEEEARLGPVPLSLQNGDEVVPTLELAGRDERARRLGIVLVSPKASETVFVAGFCALDGGAFALAERLLRHVISLSPYNANMRAELVQTLILEKKLDDADVQLDAAFQIATAPCHVGVLWRKHGYILFDRGKLVDAYNAYARSLDFDPGSENAKKEMELISNELLRTGAFDGKALKVYTPPAQGTTSVVTCP